MRLLWIISAVALGSAGCLPLIYLLLRIKPNRAWLLLLPFLLWVALVAGAGAFMAEPVAGLSFESVVVRKCHWDLRP